VGLVRRASTLAALLLAALPAAAASIGWQGGASGDWHQAANWENLTVPGPGDAVLIASGTVVAYSTNPAISVDSLTVGQSAPAAILSLSTGLSVANAVTVAAGGAIHLATAGVAVSAGDLTLQSGTSVAFTVNPSSGAVAPA
jgi:hypothetical protein